jgi:Sulfatase-modifying factor enzyme 1
MKRIIALFFLTLASSARPFMSDARADTFGSGANSFDIDFVTIGNPGNPPDANPNPAGAVPYEYRIGKYEISEQMIDKANALGGLGLTKDTRGPDYPATSVTWYECAKFVNWLNTSTGNVPAYKFDGSGNFQLWAPTDSGYDPTNLYRNKLTAYVLPSQHEWHKAAYYNPITGAYYSYPTGSNSAPDGIDFPGDPVFDAVFYDGGLNSNPNLLNDVGVPSPYGIYGQGGNVDEWNETSFDWVNNGPGKSRIRVGGSWVDGSTLLLSSNPNGASPSTERQYSGFRVVWIVPEPTAIELTIAGLSSLLARRIRRRTSFYSA